jgi:hypothetical protein
MKLIFSTTPQIIHRPVNKPSPFIKNKNNSINALETQLSFSGSMIERVRYSDKPCGSCGGR